MSAFIVEDETINKIVTWLVHGRETGWYQGLIEKLGYDLSKPLSVEKLAKDMFFLNCKAVDARYGKAQAEGFRPLDFKYREDFNFSEMSVFKSINCWHYQCSEGDEVPNDPLYLTWEKISHWIAHSIVSRMPAYNAAPWG